MALDMWSLRMTNVDGTKGAAPKRPPLAKGKVRFVGEAVAFIVADSIDVAKDAAEMIELDIDELDPHLEIAPGGPHDDDFITSVVLHLNSLWLGESSYARGPSTGSG